MRLWAQRVRSQARWSWPSATYFGGFFIASVDVRGYSYELHWRRA